MPGFDQAANQVPTSIGNIELILSNKTEPVDDQGNPLPREKGGAFRIRVLDQDGEVFEMRRGDLKAYLLANAPQVAQKLSELLNWVRNEAETKILPP